MDLWVSLAVILVLMLPLFLLVFALSSALLAKVFGDSNWIAAFTLLTFGFLGLLTVTAFGIVILHGPVNFTLLTLTWNSQPVPIFGLLADRVSLVIVLLVITVSGVVHLYSLRAMGEEPQFRRYFFLLSLITVEVLLVVLANNLLMLAFFWVLKGFTLTFLLTHYNDRPASWQAAFKKLRIDLVGDAAFLGALVLTWHLFGTFELVTINARALEAPQSLPVAQTTLLTALLFVAIMAKSAQFPLHGWLSGSVEAPTPVSAFMHAGLINAGGFLFIRLSPLFVATPFTMGLALVIGSITAFYGTLVMLTRNDVKGKLVYSTMGQMGFMIIECGLGAFALATLHLIAHGLFKATLFLNSGSAIQRKTFYEHIAGTYHPGATEGWLWTSRFLLACSLAALLLLAGPGIFGWPVNGGTILLAFVWFTVIYALSELGRLSLGVLLAGTAGFIFLYLVVTHEVETFFVTAVAPAPVVAPTLVLVVGAGLGLVGLVGVLLKTKTWRPAWLDRFLTHLYVRVLFAGYGK